MSAEWKIKIQLYTKENDTETLYELDLYKNLNSKPK